MQVSDLQQDSADAEKALAFQRESELSHHLAGILVVLSGTVALAQSRARRPLAGDARCLAGLFFSSWESIY